MNRKDISKLFKRFLITFAFSLPLLVLLGVLLEGKVSDFVMVIIFVSVAGVIIAAEEVVYHKGSAKREFRRKASADGSHFGDEVAKEEELKRKKIAQKQAKKEAEKKNKSR